MQAANDRAALVNRVLTACRGELNSLCPEPPEGWGRFCYALLTARSFPAPGEAPPPAQAAAAKLFLDALDDAVFADGQQRPWDMFRDIRLMTPSQAAGFPCGEEYERFRAAYAAMGVAQLMYLGSALFPFDPLSHTAGVHHVAYTLGRRAYEAGVEVDVALLSAAAAAHDIGKFGCRGDESRRVPYLHYYYTDQWLSSRGLHQIAHIAANHSVWDLELENLGAESLFLIYADFRVKSVRDAQGRESPRLYSLGESYRVILCKLDDLDEAKKARYERVYRKLTDFEDYLISRGVNVDVESAAAGVAEAAETALMTPAQAARALRLKTVDTNLRLMHDIGTSSAFNALLEQARSAGDRRDTRACLAVFEEYHTYMTGRQKLLTLDLTYELLMHHEGDIRRDAGRVMGQILAGSGTRFKKELPQSAPHNAAAPALMESFRERAGLWERFLEQLVHPDHKMSVKHRSRVMNSLKVVLGAAMSACAPGEQRAFLLPLLKRLEERDEAAAFVVLDAFYAIDRSCLTGEELSALEQRAQALCASSDRALAMCASRLVSALSGQGGATPESRPTAELYLENLKAATPWIVKLNNIDALRSRAAAGPGEAFQTAAHLANLIRVSEHLPVREYAGAALVETAALLTGDKCNEIVVDLSRSLESAQFEFSRYIPPCLGRLILLLPPEEQQEALDDLEGLVRSANERAACVALRTLAVVLCRDPAPSAQRRRRLAGLWMTGLAHYSPAVCQEAMQVLGRGVFASQQMPPEQKEAVFLLLVKKLLTFLSELKEDRLTRMNLSAMLHHIYRFTTDYTVSNGEFPFEAPRDAAFFPGAFDPFSTGHKGVVDELLNMGLEVYLAIDEFSWSKRTQPSLLRRRIADMSVADRFHVFLFPQGIPVNIANPADLKRLRSALAPRRVSLVVGSDVIQHASAYQAQPAPDSVHGFDHIVFARNGASSGGPGAYPAVTGKITELTLPVVLEDVSSSRIRDYIDKDLDISSLVDPVAQEFIYREGLYLRAPQYKSVWTPATVAFARHTSPEGEVVDYAASAAGEEIRPRLTRRGVRAVSARAGEGGALLGAVFLHRVNAAGLYNDLKSVQLADFVRFHTSGRIAYIDGVYAMGPEADHTARLLLTEALSDVLREDYTYALCRCGDNAILRGILEGMGFLPVPGDEGTLSVDMRFPVVMTADTAARFKEPLQHHASLTSAVAGASQRMMRALTELYPGRLVLTYDADVLYHELTRLVTRNNAVPEAPVTPRELGRYMCVPYGKILSGVVVPNTVTKTLHADKRFNSALSAFEITEYPGYAKLTDQAQAIRSFGREVLLVDDLLHNGYRLEKLDPIFKLYGVKIKKILVGVLSGRGKDLMEVQRRDVEAVYFIPNLRYWFSESLMYPFIGGDSMPGSPQGSLQPSVNLVLPYATPMFLKDAAPQSVYRLSLTALENAREILLALEAIHGELYNRTLTVGRLGEALAWPRMPDRGGCLKYNQSLPASEYVQRDIQALQRLEPVMRK